MKVRFHNLDKDTAIATVAPGHTITRWRAWFLLGGWQYCFDCRCGWKGQKVGFGSGKTNKVANRHALNVDGASPTTNL